ncbi:MAG: fluoride efflux transporter CrcB [Rhodobacteraceae bacterium]|nr:fluoride efflux transporter CrcB [Paracoccaceae bacterium]
MFPILQVALGGALGAVLRYGMVTGVARLLGTGFPLGTVAVNITGSFLMGVLMAWFAARASAVWAVPLLTAGLLGGFTTFSAFSLETVALCEQGRWLAASVYVVVSVAGSVVALAGGLTLMRGV